MVARGVVVEFDFAALNGADLLFETTRDYLRGLDDIPFDRVVEAEHMAGRSFQKGLSSYFSAVKTKKTSAKAARELWEAFGKAVSASLPKAVPPGFRNFVKALSAKNVKVVVATRADLSVAAAALEPLAGPSVALYGETCDVYGCARWDSWRRACAANGLKHRAAIAVTGSGHGVKSALMAGMGSMAVIGGSTAYQDFGGADAVVDELNSEAARTVLGMLRV